MLDGDPDPRPSSVAAGDVRGQRLPARLGPLELGHQAAPRQQRDVGGRAIGRVGPDWARRVIGIEQAAELPAIVRGRVGHREAADEAVPTVDAEVVLVAEDGDHELGLGPAR